MPEYKIKKNLLLFLTFLISTINTSILQGTSSNLIEEEESLIISHTQNFLSDKNHDDTSISRLKIETDNLLDETVSDNIANKVSNSYILAFQNDSEKRTSKYLIFKYIISLVGGIGPIIPQLAIPLQIGQDYGSDILGYALAATTILTIEGIASWMIWELIDDTEKLVKATRQHQKNSNACNLQSIKEVGIGVLSLVLGAFSSAPDVYKTYKYNTIKEFAFISFFYDTIPHTIGFYKLFSSLKSENIKKVCSEKNIVERQGVKIIDLSKAYFLEQCKENGIETVSRCLSNFDTSKEVYSYLISHIEQNVREVDSPHYFAKGIPRNIVKCLAIIPPFATAAGLNMILSYRGYNLFIDDQASLILLSTLSVLPAFLLNTYVITEAAGKLFDKFFLCKSRIPSSEYFTNFHPQINTAFIVSALILGAASSVGGFYLIADNLEDTFLSSAKYIFATLAVGTDLTFGTYTIYSSMRRYGEAIKEKLSSGTSYIFNCLKKLNNIRSSIINSSSDVVENFINDITPHPEPLN